jgi:hypothetical protein
MRVSPPTPHGASRLAVDAAFQGPALGKARARTAVAGALLCHAPEDFGEAILDPEVEEKIQYIHRVA